MNSLSQRQKAAILLMSLPPEVSAQLFKELGPQEAQQITSEIANLPSISAQMRATVVEEFLAGAGSPRPQAGGGGHHPIPDFPLPRPEGPPRPLGFLRRMRAPDLANLLRQEHAQTIAVVLSCLDSPLASLVLAEMLPVMQSEVARRLAQLGSVQPEVMASLQSILEERLCQLMEDGQPVRRGRDALIDILSHSNRATEDSILGGLCRDDPGLASDLKHKLCDFEDLLTLDDTSFEQVLRLTDYRDLALALKGSPRELTERVYCFLNPKWGEPSNRTWKMGRRCPGRRSRRPRSGSAPASGPGLAGQDHGRRPPLKFPGCSASPIEEGSPASAVRSAADRGGSPPLHWLRR